MQPERQYAVTVVGGVAAFGACVALHVNGLVAVAVGLVYAAAAYYVAEEPGMLRGRDGPNWESGAVAGVTTFALVSLLQVEPGVGVVALAFGLAYFGNATGYVAARRQAE